MEALLTFMRGLLVSVQDLFSRRLRAARVARKMSQRAVGMLAGIEEFSAGVRMSQYETGRHTPDITISKHIADALGVPLPYFYCDDDQLAQLILELGDMRADERSRFIEACLNII